MKEENEKREKKEKSAGDLVTRESVGAVGAIFSLFAFLILLTGTAIFGDIGYAVKSFLLGVFGYFAYFLLPVAFLVSGAAFIGKSFFKKKAAVWIVLSVVFAFLVVHTVATYSWKLDGYLAACFQNAGYGVKSATPAGFAGAVVVYLLRKFASDVGAIVVLSLFFVLFALLSFKAVTGKSIVKGVFAATAKRREKAQAKKEAPAPTETVPASAEQPQAPVYQTVNEQYAYQAPAAPRQQEPVRPEYVPMSPEIRQRPGVLLSDEGYTNASNLSKNPTGEQTAFSPFGFGAREEGGQAPERQYQSDREFLFGGNPADNYRKNLIFDANARVNRKPAADPNQPTYNAPSADAFSSSYTSAYENAVNDEPETVRPEKIVAESGYRYTEARRAEEPVEPTPTVVEPTAAESAPTLDYTAYEPVRPEFVERPSPREEEFLSPVRDRLEEPTREEPTIEEAPRRESFRDIFSPSNPNIFGGGGEDEAFLSSAREERRRIEREEEEELFPSEPTLDRGREERADTPPIRSIDIFDEEDEEEEDDAYSVRDDYRTVMGDTNATLPPEERRTGGRDRSIDRFPSRRSDGGVGDRLPRSRMPAEAEPPREPVAPPPPPKPKVIRPYQTAPIDFFDCKDVEPDANEAEVGENKRTILDTLSGFKVTDATIASVTYGPTVTRYNVAIPKNISPRKVVSLDQEIAMNLYARGGVNIYPNFEEGAVSIEVPNKKRQFVGLGCMLTGDGFTKCKPTSLTFAMGKDVGNKKVYGDIRKMTHLLVAGASGSGKSVFLRCLIVSLIVKYSPADLRLILIDPKKTEFVIYDHLPHLVINEIITETPKVIQSLNWVIGEMNRRYTLFEQKSRSGTYVVNVDEYNANLTNGEEKLPKIVIIVDELADLMLAAKKDIEDRIQNLTQKSRAAGIHMILATQRPSADVITGVIKSNLKTRIAFSVASDVDSRVILDASGAQKLLGMGDMLYTVEGMNTPVRVQSASLESEDAQKVVNYIKVNNDCDFDESVSAFINNTKGDGAPVGDGGGEELVEEVYIEAVRYVIQNGSASISMIQRKCSVGYNKAGKIIEWMEDLGYISAFDGAKARKVLITPEEFQEKYGDL